MGRLRQQLLPIAMDSAARLLALARPLFSSVRSRWPAEDKTCAAGRAPRPTQWPIPSGRPGPHDAGENDQLMTALARASFSPLSPRCKLPDEYKQLPEHVRPNVRSRATPGERQRGRPGVSFSFPPPAAKKTTAITGTGR